MKRIIHAIAAALCAGLLMMSCTLAPAAAAAQDPGEIVLPSGESVSKTWATLDALAGTGTSEEAVFASAAIGIFQGDSVLGTRYYGMTDMENHIAADENAVYEWGSISKTFIWVSAMQLYEQGLLDLERDVREYLPPGFFRHLTYDEPITMLHLMNHNAGWQETIRPIMVKKESDVLPLGEALQAIEPVQIHRPGEVTAYSNYGAAVAGYVIECITGQDYCDYVHAHILEPLGMEHTAVNPTHSDNAWVQERRREMKSYSFLLNTRVSLGPCLDYIPAYPAGSATGTLDDLLLYAQALADKSAPLFEDPQTQELMFSGTQFYGESDIPVCAHGFWCSEQAVRTYGHDGATMAGQAEMCFDPESGTGLVVLVNEPNGNVFLENAADIVFGTLTADRYSAGGTYPARDLGGYYTAARSVYRGPTKFMNVLSAVSLTSLGEPENLGSGLYQLRVETEPGQPDAAALFGERVSPDDRLLALETPSNDLLPDAFYIPKLCLFTGYMLLAVAAVYLLLIRRKRRRHGRWTPYKGAGIVKLGWIAWLLSVLVMLSVIMIVSSNDGGIPYAQGVVCGILQMLAAAVCAASAVTSCLRILTGRQRTALSVLHGMNMAGCLLVIVTIGYFEMYRFWSM